MESQVLWCSSGTENGVELSWIKGWKEGSAETHWQSLYNLTSWEQKAPREKGKLFLLLRTITCLTNKSIQGVQKKMCRSFCLISLVTNILGSWDIIHWKGGIHSFVWSTKTFLYDIWEPRYKQIKMGYQILKCLNIGKSSVLKYDTALIYA